MNWFLIPLTATPQTFAISLAGVNYSMTIYWNDSLDTAWQFNLDNADTSTSLIAGAPMITGADLLAGLRYLGIGGSLFVYTNGIPANPPTFTNLGTNCNLYFVTDATVNG